MGIPALASKGIWERDAGGQGAAGRLEKAQCFPQLPSLSWYRRRGQNNTVRWHLSCWHFQTFYLIWKEKFDILGNTVICITSVTAGLTGWTHPTTCNLQVTQTPLHFVRPCTSPHRSIFLSWMGLVETLCVRICQEANILLNNQSRCGLASQVSTNPKIPDWLEMILFIYFYFLKL